jgi:hypothetical protein
LFRWKGTAAHGVHGTCTERRAPAGGQHTLEVERAVFSKDVSTGPAVGLSAV